MPNHYWEQNRSASGTDHRTTGQYRMEPGATPPRKMKPSDPAMETGVIKAKPELALPPGMKRGPKKRKTKMFPRPKEVKGFEASFDPFYYTT